MLDANEFSSGDTEIQDLTIFVENQYWRINNVYAHVDHFSDEYNWNFLSEVADCEWKSLITGGFNARSKEWENLTENRQGIALNQALLSSNLAELQNWQRDQAIRMESEFGANFKL